MSNSNLNGRVSKLEKLTIAKGGPPKILVCRCGVGKPCNCQDDDNDYDILIQVVYRDSDPDNLD